MSKTVPTFGMDATQWEPKLPFDLVVAYEDTHTRNRALHLYDHLAQGLLDDYDFKCGWWKFDHLSNTTLRQQAADSAAEANMVVLSLQARKQLLPAHKAWIEEWLPRRDSRKAALVVLIGGTDNMERESAPLLAELQLAARLGRMDFFTHAFDLTAAQRVASVQQITDRARASREPLPDFLQHRMPIPRWGINE